MSAIGLRRPAVIRDCQVSHLGGFAWDHAVGWSGQQFGRINRLAADSCGRAICQWAMLPLEHGVLVRCRLWNRLSDIPMLDDLSAFELEDVDDCISTSAWLSDCVNVEDHKVTIHK